MFNDLRFAVRMLWKSPGFTVVAVIVLALGIGANSAMFSLVNALALRPLAARQPGQLVGCYSRETKPSGAYRGFSYPNYRDIREQNVVLSSLLAHNPCLVGLTEGESTRRIFADVVSANYFSTFGVRPAQGRDFLAEEEAPGAAAPVAIVSYPYWQKMGTDPGLIGRTIRVNGRALTIVGVAPKHFTGTAAIFSPELYLPLSMYDAVANDFMNEERRMLSARDHHALLLVGRLKNGLGLHAAEAQLKTLAQRLAETFPAENKDQTMVLAPLPRLSITSNPQNDRGELASLSIMLLSLSGVVLLIACLNLANMLLARGSAKRREVAIRLALGGGRRQIIRQLLIEGAILACLGGLAGLALAWWSTQLLVASLAPRLSFLSIVFQLGPDWRVFGATLAFGVLATILFGLGPAWRLSRADVVSDLKEQTGDTHVRGLRRGLFAARNLLVIGQIALSLALLVTAVLFIRGARKAAQADPGYRLERKILVGLDPALNGYTETRGRTAYRSILDRVRTLPGVEAASLASVVSFGDFSDGCSVKRGGSGNVSAGLNPGGPPGSTTGNTATNSAPREHDEYANLNIVGADYFKALDLTLLRGREFSIAEESSEAGARVAIIDEPLARRLFPGEEALGRFILSDRHKAGAEPQPMQIVGLVPGVRHSLFDKEPPPHLYLPFGHDYRSGMNLHLKVSVGGREGETAFLQTLRRELRAVDANLAVLSLTTLRNHRDDGLLLWFVRTGANLFTVFGIVAVVLAVVGVYAVKAYVVARRTREIGIRMALGATRREVQWMVLREGAALTLAGLTVGLVLALAAGKVLSNALYEVSATDPVALCVAPLVLASAAMLACYLPARRATRVQPLSALRCE